MGLFSAIMFVVSMAVQYTQAQKVKKAKRAAEAAADAAKGFQLVKSGEAAPIPVIYGRNKVGGIRVYHNTFNNYAYSPSVEAELANAGATVLSGNNVVLPNPPVYPVVRFYFTGPAKLDILKPPNTAGADSPPILMTAPLYAIDDGNGGHYGDSTQSSGGHYGGGGMDGSMNNSAGDASSTGDQGGALA